MTAPGALCDIRPFEKYAYFLVCSSAKNIFSPAFQTELSSTPFFIFWSPHPLRVRQLMTRILGLRPHGSAIIKPIVESAHDIDGEMSENLP